MKSYNEYDEMFGESSQGYLVTSLPFSSSSTIIYANNRAASILELPSVSITGQTLGNIFSSFFHIHGQYGCRTVPPRAKRQPAAPVCLAV